MPATSEAANWEELEQTVARAVALLDELRRKNRALERRVRQLEKELAAAQESPAPPPATESLGAVRERLQRLEGDLASLLG